MSPAASDRRRRRPRADPARVAAYDTVHAVHVRDAYANLVLPGLLRSRHLDGRDAAFATELAYGSLRGQGTYDLVLGQCVDRSLTDVDSDVLDVLRLGVHQLLAMRVPAHAATSETVELARGVLGDGRARFVNAVLRRVGERDRAEWVAAVAPDAAANPLGYLAVAHAHPRWVVAEFAQALEADPATEAGAAELAALLVADNEPPRVTLVARPGRATPQDLLALGAQPGRWSPLAGVLPAGDPAAWPGVRSGAIGVQDEGSQLVTLAAVEVEVEAKLRGSGDQRWLDLCAGPGGKAALLAGLAGRRGATLTANELQPHRAELVRQAIGPGVELIIGDGRAGPWSDGTFDRVLVDAPCTGLGALRRRPEARWRRVPEDVRRLVPLQRGLLGAAIDATRPGGVIAYVTCSPVLDETRRVVDTVTAARGDVERLDATAVLSAVTRAEPPIELGPGPDVQLWPHRHGTDAMYLALLRRR